MLLYYYFNNDNNDNNKDYVILGLHTPGVQTALVQLAPPYSGVITGLSFFFVAWFGIGNKLLTKHIVQHGTEAEWAKVCFG